jgi:hypothetical protein
MNELGIITLVLDPSTPPFTRLEIWLDPQTQQWCIGPLRGPFSTAVVWQELHPHEFFMRERSGSK